MRTWILGLVCLVSISSAQGSIDACPTGACLTIAQHARELLLLKFPRLVDRQLKVAEFEDDSSYFRTDVENVLGSGAERTYVLKVNPAAFDSNHQLPDEALRAVLVHELSHLNDFTQMTSLEIAELGLRYLDEGQASVVNYEQSTDYVTILKGFSEGLVLYRLWLYGSLGSPSAVKLKRRVYLTPMEIRRIVAEDARKARSEFESILQKTIYESNSYEGWYRKGQVSSEK